MLNKKLSFNKMRTFFFFTVIIILSIAMLYLFRPFFYPIFWAAVLASMFYPMYQWILRHVRHERISIVIAMILVFIIIFLPLVIITLLIINQSIQIYQSISPAEIEHNINTTSQWLLHTPLAPYIEQARLQWPIYLSDGAKSLSTFIFNSASNITQNSLRFGLMTFLTFYSLYYFFKDGPKILRKLMHFSPLGDKYEQMLYDRFTSAARAALKTTFILGGIQGLLTGVLFWFTGIPGSLIWAIVTMIAAMIPGLGSFVIWMPAGVIMLVLGHTWQGLTILAVGLLIISTIDNLLRPSLIGKDIQMHPLIVMFATIGGIFVFGISGFVIGPIIAALYLAVMSIYDFYYRNELNNN